MTGKNVSVFTICDAAVADKLSDYWKLKWADSEGKIYARTLFERELASATSPVMIEGLVSSMEVDWIVSRQLNDAVEHKHILRIFHGAEFVESRVTFVED